jgi:hypothetical protein
MDLRDWSDWKHNWKVRHNLYMVRPKTCKFPREIEITLPDYIEAYDLDDMLVYIEYDKIPDLINFLKEEYARNALPGKPLG